MRPKAFLSYAHWDDDDEGLTKLHDFLSREVRRFYGREFPIFQDKTDIEWGENWRKRIEESLDEVTFLIPIITPTFLNSDECRAEVRLFLEHEQQLQRDDLVLPLYFVESPLWDDEQERQNDEIVQALRRHQFVDWRELRGKPFDDQEVKDKLENLARHIRNALNRVQAAGGQLENKTPRNAPASRISQTGTVLSSISTTGRQDDLSSREPTEKRLIAVDLSIIESQMQVIDDYRLQALDLVNENEFEEAIEQFDLAVRNCLSVLKALHRERRRHSTENQDTPRLQGA
jgi:hypothetical protein